MQVSGSVVVITGGASGLGAGLAEALVEGGARVAILDRTAAAGEQLAERLHSRFYLVDVTQSGAVERAIHAVVAELGRIDVCVNCAGINTARRMLNAHGELHSLELFCQTLQVNLIGAFDVLRHCVAAMARNEPGMDGERGLIVNVASIAALEGQAGQVAYAASKGALVAMTLPLARDLAPLGIRAMAVCPGVMGTAMLEALRPELQEVAARLPVFPRRLGSARDFAQLVTVFMETNWLNGEVVRLDAATRLG